MSEAEIKVKAILDCISQIYNVDAKLGKKVTYNPGKPYKALTGYIVGAHCSKILVQFDGETFAQPFHPKAFMEYLND